jgi:hypothetical protein
MGLAWLDQYKKYFLPPLDYLSSSFTPVIKDVRLGMGSVRHRLLLQRKFRRMDNAVHSMEIKPVRVRPSATAAPNTGKSRLAELTDPN